MSTKHWLPAKDWRQGSKDVLKKLREMRAVAEQGDYESAHAIEREILLGVLRRIAGGANDPEFLARKALLTTREKFPRWMA